MKTKSLIIGGSCNIFIGLLHVVMVFIGPKAYIYFGAGQEMADMAEAGSWIPALSTLFLACVFTLFGLYAYSGAGVIRKLPLLKAGLWIIGSVYFLRGFLIIYQIMYFGDEELAIGYHSLAFSVVSALIGLLYLHGVINLSKRDRPH